MAIKAVRVGRQEDHLTLPSSSSSSSSSIMYDDYSYCQSYYEDEEDVGRSGGWDSSTEPLAPRPTPPRFNLEIWLPSPSPEYMPRTPTPRPPLSDANLTPVRGRTPLEYLDADVQLESPVIPTLSPPPPSPIPTPPSSLPAQSPPPSSPSPPAPLAPQVLLDAIPPEDSLLFSRCEGEHPGAPWIR